jgi:hypothetical protein
MSLSTEFSLNDNGFLAEAFKGKLVPVLNESGGLGVKPEYLIVIRNKETDTAYRLKGIAFVSTYEFIQGSNGAYSWTLAESRAQNIATKVANKGIVDLSLWVPFNNPEPVKWKPPQDFLDHQEEKRKKRLR